MTANSTLTDNSAHTANNNHTDNSATITAAPQKWNI